MTKSQKFDSKIDLIPHALACEICYQKHCFKTVLLWGNNY